MASTHEHMADVVKRYVQGFAEGDADGLTALFAGDGSIEDPVGSPLKVGRAATAAHYDRATAAGLELRLDGPIRTAADHAAFAFSAMMASGTQIDVIDMFRFDNDGKIVEMHAFWSDANVSQRS